MPAAAGLSIGATVLDPLAIGGLAIGRISIRRGRIHPAPQIPKSSRYPLHPEFRHSPQGPKRGTPGHYSGRNRWNSRWLSNSSTTNSKLLGHESSVFHRSLIVVGSQAGDLWQ